MKTCTDHLIRLTQGHLDAWIDLDGITDLDTAREHLEEHGFDLDKGPHALEAEGFAQHFLDPKAQTFDLPAYLAFAQLPDSVDEDAVEAFIAWQGFNNAKVELVNFQNYYIGEYPSRAAFAEAYHNDSAHEVVSQAQEYGLVIDWDATGDSMLNNGFVGQEYGSNLYVFLNI